MAFYNNVTDSTPPLFFYKIVKHLKTVSLETCLTAIKSQLFVIGQQDAFSLSKCSVTQAQGWWKTVPHCRLMESKTLLSN